MSKTAASLPPKIRHRLGRTMRAYRIGRKLSPSQLAAKAGVSVAVVVQIEAGDRIPSQAMLWTLVRATGRTVADFWASVLSNRS